MAWWAWTPGASWRHPMGPAATSKARSSTRSPRSAYEDADAYARWAGKSLPTEAQWERAGRGGLEDADFAWGDEIAPGGEERMNRWIGEFPWKFRPRPGGPRKPGTVPVRSYEPNPFGLYEVTGNTWEWTTTWFSDKHDEPTSRCCAPSNPRGPSVDAEPRSGQRNPAQGDQGRLVPLRRELLQPLPAFVAHSRRASKAPPATSRSAAWREAWYRLTVRIG